MMNYSQIDRALGHIEGIGIGIGGRAGEILQAAAAAIDLEIKEERMKTLIAEEQAESKDTERGYSCSCTTAGAIELADRLNRHYLDHVEGKTQNMSRICNDCIQAAGVIAYLLEELSQRDMTCCAENP